MLNNFSLKKGTLVRKYVTLQITLTYQTTTMIIITAIRTTNPTLIPITIHFQPLLFGSSGLTVGYSVGELDSNKVSISEMFAPMAASISGL